MKISPKAFRMSSPMQNEDQKTSADFYKNKEARLSYQHERLANNVYVVKCFLDAIEQNKDKFKDKIVLHLSCGLGLLSLAAAKAGAAHVYAIDDANVHHFTEEIIKTTQGGYYKDKITVIHEQLKDVVLPLKMDQKVDIIICEWMGYCGILESKIYDVLFARDKWLNKEGGLILPDEASLSIYGAQNMDLRHSKIDVWKDAEGVKMNSIRKEARKVPFTNDYYKNENEKNITNVEECFHVDLYKVKPEELNFEKKIALHCVHDNTNLDAIVGEFRCKFNLPNFIDFEVNNKILDEKYLKDIEPKRRCIWKPLYFLLGERFKLERGDRIPVNIKMKFLGNTKTVDIDVRVKVRRLAKSIMRRCCDGRFDLEKVKEAAHELLQKGRTVEGGRSESAEEHEAEAALEEEQEKKPAMMRYTIFNTKTTYKVRST